MSGFASCLVALALAQADAEKAATAESPPAASNAGPTAAPTPNPTPTPTTPTPTATSTSTATPTSTPTPTSTSTATVDGAAIRPERSPGAKVPARSRKAATSTPAPTPTATPQTAKLEPDRDQALRLARTFLEALAAGDSNALAQAASDRFSFDGEALSGRDAVRRRWRELLADRPGPAPRVNGVEVLAAQDAVARYGKPPARVAALARPGVWVAVGDVGGRPVVLFVAREGARLAVLGIHD